MRKQEEDLTESSQNSLEWMNTKEEQDSFGEEEASDHVQEPFEKEMKFEKDADEVDDFMSDISQSLSSQIREELSAAKEPQEELEIEESKMRELEQEDQSKSEEKKRSLKKRVLIIIGSVIGSLLLVIGILFGTKFGRGLMYNLAAKFIHGQIDKVEPTPSPIPTPTPTPTPQIKDEQDNPPVTTVPIEEVLLPRQEDYVMTCLLFGIEEIYGARNTDSMMLAAINTRDKSVKLASIMRDTYAKLPGHNPCKLNAVYALGNDRAEGAALLVQAVEDIYNIKIDAYASVNFEAFEDIVDLLGGVTIELTAQERDYLNTTNYISNPANRRVKAGVQTLNGNQVVGYCRVRFIPTLGGAADDYGRTLRQRRVLNAIFQQYKSKGLFELISIANTCLGYVSSNLTADQIAKGLEMIVENGITSLESSRFPAEGTFYDCGKTAYNGLKYTLVSTDPAENTSQMYQFIFGDQKEEAKAKANQYYEDTAQRNEP